MERTFNPLDPLGLFRKKPTPTETQEAGIREIHNGLVYDVRTATLVFSAEGVQGVHRGETTNMYKTLKGRFFLQRFRGGRPLYSRNQGFLSPCDVEDAKEWYNWHATSPSHKFTPHLSFEEAFEVGVEEA